MSFSDVVSPVLYLHNDTVSMNRNYWTTTQLFKQVPLTVYKCDV